MDDNARAIWGTFPTNVDQASRSIGYETSELTCVSPGSWRGPESTAIVIIVAFTCDLSRADCPDSHQLNVAGIVIGAAIAGLLLLAVWFRPCSS